MNCFVALTYGILYFSTKDMDAICPGDDFGYVPQPNGRNVLGKGGNGRVIRHVISNYHFALKLVSLPHISSLVSYCE